jgi:hypothetical protein
MFNRRFVLTALVVVLAVMLSTPSTQAGASVGKVNQVTFSAPVALPGVVLLPGKYAFEAGALGMSPNIVRVTSADYQKLYYVGFTQRLPRPAALASNEVISLGEGSVGTPTPIRAWYPIGSQAGHEFLYR